MPEIRAYTDIDVDVDEFVSSCNKREINELIEELVFNGYLNENSVIVPSNNMGLMESMFVEKLSKLTSCYYRLTTEELQTLENLFKKYV
jgi:hypothetical protein